ncbi:ABC transporter substrate-binding protein [Streptomyces sp. ITFR-16]|uniref:ABC transporter substrate-binding protein n=1 Tax=Streptomyces sp. ITFR-16 TaxID=3075198 RepID=UPI00288BC94C|nr:ABC transporter substrate-binding protein [Streptomyces sp. ITFR-16]WNI20790.1 ABC transporter substrate-binding protein [Streptomyces sp. ITFR-16]
MSDPRRRALPSLAAVTVLSLALGACSSSGADSAGGSAPHSGGHLTFALASDPICVDPQQAGNNDAIYPARQIVDSLTDQDPKTGKIVPWLATSWKVSEDASVFTFTLRKGATFSDGTPVNARAVKSNFDGIVKLGAKSVLGSSYLAGYKSTTVIDDHTAKVTFDSPNAQFLQATSTFTLGLLAESTVKLPAEKRCTDNLIGSGPFTLDGYTPNKSVEERRRPGYSWGSSLWKRKGPAYLDRLTFKVIPESGVRTGSLQSGQVDAIGGVAPQDEAGLKSTGFPLKSRANPGLPFGLTTNAARPITKDLKVRQAIQKAIDRQEVVDTVLSDSYRPATSSLASTTSGYKDLSDRLGHDPAGAGKLLDEAGWRTGPDGIRTKGGKKLALKIIWASNFGPNQTALELIQQQLKKTGIQVTLQSSTIGDYVALRQKGDYDFAWGNTTRVDPDILRTGYSSKLLNLGHLSDHALDSVLDKEASASDPAERAAHVAEAQQIVLDKGYQIPVFELTTVLGLSKKVHDLDFEASSRLQFHETWLS